MPLTPLQFEFNCVNGHADRLRRELDSVEHSLLHIKAQLAVEGMRATDILEVHNVATDICNVENTTETPDQVATDEKVMAGDTGRVEAEL